MAMWPILEFHTPWNIFGTANFVCLQDISSVILNFVHGLATRSTNLQMTNYPLSGRGDGHVTNFRISHPWNIFGTANFVCLRDISSVILRMTDHPWKGCARVTWSFSEFYTPLNFPGMSEDKIVKFCAQVGPIIACLVMTNFPPDGRGQDHVTSKIFLTNNVNISKTVQDRAILTMEEWPIKRQQRQWPWRSFAGCRPFQMQSVEHLCSILHDFNWQCARTVPLH